MPNFITIHDDVLDVDTKVNLDDNEIIHIGCVDTVLLNVIANEIAEQLVKLSECFVFYFSKTTIFNFHKSNSCEISDEIDWSSQFQITMKEYKNVVLFVDMREDGIDDYYKCGNRESFELNVKINRLIKNNPDFTFIFLSDSRNSAYYVNKRYWYGFELLKYIKYNRIYGCPILLLNFLDRINKLPAKEKEYYEKLANNLLSNYFLGCLKVYRLLKSNKCVYLDNVPNGIYLDQKLCKSDIDDILFRIFRFNIYIKYDNITKMYYCEKQKELYNAMNELLSHTTFSEVAKALILQEDNVSKVLEVAQFNEWYLFEHEQMWCNLKFDTIKSIYFSNKDKQDFVKTCAISLSKNVCTPDNVIKFIRFCIDAEL